MQYELLIANTVNITAWYTCNDSGAVKSTTAGYATVTALVELPARAVVQESVLYLTVVGTGVGGFKRLNVSCGGVTRNLTGNMENACEFLSVVRGTGEYAFQIIYEDNGRAGTPGVHPITLGIQNIRIVITYSVPGHDGDDSDDERDVVVNRPFRTEAPEDWITLNDDTTRGVLAVLHPLKCKVKEVVAGSYELEMLYPTDDDTWRKLTVDRLIRAPVPRHRIAPIVVQNPVFYETITRTALWSRVPAQYKKDIKASPYNYQTVYHYGAIVTYNGQYYEFISSTPMAGTPPSAPGIWRHIDPYVIVKVPGAVIRELPNDTLFVKLGDLNSAYIQVRTQAGEMGYVKLSDCQISESSFPGDVYTVEERNVKRQFFRIYATELSSYDHTVKINARHISYDLDAVMLGDCSVVEASPSVAIGFIQGCYIGGDNVDARIIATDIADGTITQTWTHSSPVSALLDPDSGVVSVLKAQLYRDDDDFIIRKDEPHRSSVNLTYGVNLLGVTVETDISDLVTRIIPIAKDENGDPFYLDPEGVNIYIDSEHIDKYAYVRHEVLEVDEQVGRHIEPTDGSTSYDMSTLQVREKMREAVAKRYYDDNCDKPKITITVEFVLLGDSEEYKQYRNLQYVYLYDVVQVYHPGLNVSVDIQVTEYEWDAILRRYNSITLGDPYEYGGGTVAGYQIGNRAIQLRSLSPALKEALNL